MELKVDEIEIKGGWLFDSVKRKMTADSNCQRIAWLTNSYLKPVAKGNWMGLFLDLKDDRYWELNYPQSELQGGGPPSLNVISKQEAYSKYNIPE